MKNRHGTLEHRFLHSIMQLTSLVTETFVISILPIKMLHTKPYGTEWYGSLLCDTFRSSPQDDGQGERDKEVALTQIRVFNLWITCSVRNKLLWALQYANVSPRCRQRPISERQLSRVFVAVPRCADFVHFTGGTGRLSSCGLWMLQISTMANFETSLWTFEAFWLVQAINMTKRSAISRSWSKLTILSWVSRFFNCSHDKTPSLMVVSEISCWNEMFLCSIKTEMFTVAES